MILKAIVLGVLFYVGICAFMFFRQISLIFPSHLAPKSVEKDFPIFLSADGTKLESKSLIGSKNDDVVVLFTGNAQNATYIADTIYKAFNTEVTIETLNYRSYGFSEGEPSEKHVFADALAFTRFIQQKYPHRKLFVMGISLGTGVASYVAGQIKVDGIILNTPFDSIVNIAKSSYPFLPVDVLLQHKFNNIKNLKNNHAPIAIIRAGADEVIPAENTQNLVEKTKNIVFDLTAKGMKHTQILDPAQSTNLKNIINTALIALKNEN